MKKYIAIIKTTQEWKKEIKIPKNVEDLKDYVNNDFEETHYNNFNDSWKNNSIFEEEHELLSVEQLRKVK